MWLAGAAVAFKVPSQRKSTLAETHVAVAGYLCGLFLLKWLIGIAATTSSEQLMATYSQALPVNRQHHIRLSAVHALDTVLHDSDYLFRDAGQKIRHIP